METTKISAIKLLIFERVTAIKSNVLPIISGIGGYILKPEGLTAFATLAAAVAAFLSWLVADKQERATYNNQLYTQQIASLAQFESKASHYINYRNKLYKLKTNNENPELFNSMSESFAEESEAFIALSLVMPREIRDYLHTMQDEMEVNVPSLESGAIDIDKESRQSALITFGRKLADITECSARQFGDGA